MITERMILSIFVNKTHEEQNLSRVLSPAVTVIFLKCAVVIKIVVKNFKCLVGMEKSLGTKYF